MKLLDIVHSKTDNATKFVFQVTLGGIAEVTSINKGDEKWIVCMPSQTGCSMNCKFCFMSTIKVPARNLTADEIYDLFRAVEELATNKEMKLLVSFMGAGEPLLNTDHLIRAMRDISNWYGFAYDSIKFAVATMMPSIGLVQYFIDAIELSQLPVKLHLSLHSTDPVVRKDLIPGSSVRPFDCIRYLHKYKSQTDNAVEVHYSLIAGVNDSYMDRATLISDLYTTGIPIKLLKFNAGVSETLSGSEREEQFMKGFRAFGIKAELYTPPGGDIGSSCGQFTAKYYL